MFYTWMWCHFACPDNCKNGLFPFSFSPNLGRVTRPMNPISLPSTAQNSTSAPLFRCPEPRFLIPQNTIWDVPFYHLGCPILPFGVSHFAIWGIPFCLLGYFKACLCPHIGAVLPSLRADFFPLSGKNGRQNVCLSPQLSGNQTTRSLLQCPHAGWRQVF